MAIPKEVLDNLAVNKDTELNNVEPSENSEEIFHENLAETALSGANPLIESSAEDQEIPLIYEQLQEQITIIDDEDDMALSASEEPADEDEKLDTDSMIAALIDAEEDEDEELEEYANAPSEDASIPTDTILSDSGTGRNELSEQDIEDDSTPAESDHLINDNIMDDLGIDEENDEDFHFDDEELEDELAPIPTDTILSDSNTELNELSEQDIETDPVLDESDYLINDNIMDDLGIDEDEDEELSFEDENDEDEDEEELSFDDEDIGLDEDSVEEDDDLEIPLDSDLDEEEDTIENKDSDPFEDVELDDLDSEEDEKKESGKSKKLALPSVKIPKLFKSPKISRIFNPFKKAYDKLVGILIAGFMFILNLLSKIPFLGKYVKMVMSATDLIKRIFNFVPLVLLLGVLVLVFVKSVPGDSGISLPDQGSATVSVVSSDNGAVTVNVVNTGDVIAEVTPYVEIYSWNPSLNPISWVKREATEQCVGESVSVEIESNVSTIIECKTGIMSKPVASLVDASSGDIDE